jgi:general secretion pathway protein N
MSPNIKNQLKYGLLILFCYLFFLLSTLPAGVVYNLWKRQAANAKAPVELFDIDGSVWSGRIGRAVIQGHKFNAFKWDVHLTSLIAGMLEMDFDLNVPDGFAKGTAGYSLFGSVNLSNIEAWLPLAQIDSFIKLSALKPGGALDIKLSKLKFTSDHGLVSAQGDIAWHSAEMTLFKKVNLGDLQVTFEPNQDGIKGVLNDQGGPLRADGVLQLSPDKSYTFNGSFGLRGDQPDLQAALTTMGRFDRDGKVNVSLKGNLAQFGF